MPCRADDDLSAFAEMTRPAVGIETYTPAATSAPS
jgi:hypothetical protein